MTELVHSSNSAWLSDSTDIMPKITNTGISTFSPLGVQSAQLIGAISAGRFDSYFAGKKSPLLADAKQEESTESKEASPENEKATGSRYFCESLFWASQPKQAAKT